MKKEKDVNSETEEKVKVIKEKKPRNYKKLKYGTLATVITVIVIAVVVLANVVVGVIMDKKPLKLDFTDNKIYELSDQTIDYLKNIKQDVEIAVIADRPTLESNPYGKYAAEIMDKFGVYSDKVHVSYVNATKEPEKIAKYKEIYTGGEIADGSVVIRSGNFIRVKSLNDLFVTETDNNGSSSIKGIKVDQVISSAVMYVTNSEHKKVGMIYDGNINAETESSFQGTFELNGYDVSAVNLLNEDISSDLDMIVLFAPLNDLTTTQIDKLQAFLDNGNNYGKQMIYVADVSQYETPNIDAFLEEWGMKIGRSYVVETDSSKALQMGKAYAPIATISEDVYSAGLASTTVPIGAFIARPIELLWEANSERMTTALLKTSDTSALASLKDEGTIDTTHSGQQIITAVCEKYKYDGMDKYSSKLMVIGSTYLINKTIVEDASYRNGSYFVNAINILANKEASIAIDNKTFDSKTITITEGQSKNVGIFVEAVIPMMVVVAGIIVFVRRRNR